jgi:hypothetical protein
MKSLLPRSVREHNKGKKNRPGPLRYKGAGAPVIGAGSPSIDSGISAVIQG